MGDAVPVGVSFKPGFFTWPLEPGEPQRAAGYELVDVGTDADARGAHTSIMPYAKRGVDDRAMMDQ